MQSKRMYREIHVSSVGFNKGTLIRHCFIPDCLLIKLEVGVLVLGRVEIQRNKGVEIMIHKYFLLSLKLKLGQMYCVEEVTCNGNRTKKSPFNQNYDCHRIFEINGLYVSMK